ncbi:hypothetical protein ACFRAQ_34465 [Nocardia sp. NPDC056611]|uniref:hypothetical protein n=1 Tax=Nocardia sp. NPDC056611 TaxID=3345877 RepID=UPI00366E7168
MIALVRDVPPDDGVDELVAAARQARINMRAAHTILRSLSKRPQSEAGLRLQADARSDFQVMIERRALAKQRLFDRLYELIESGQATFESASARCQLDADEDAEFKAGMPAWRVRTGRSVYSRRYTDPGGQYA